LRLGAKVLFALMKRVTRKAVRKEEKQRSSRCGAKRDISQRQVCALLDARAEELEELTLAGVAHTSG
jgi:hypothetical protein